MKYIGLLIFHISYTAHYGWNLSPTTTGELILDSITLLLFFVFRFHDEMRKGRAVHYNDYKSRKRNYDIDHKD